MKNYLHAATRVLLIATVTHCAYAGTADDLNNLANGLKGLSNALNQMGGGVQQQQQQNKNTSKGSNQDTQSQQRPGLYDTNEESQREYLKRFSETRENKPQTKNELPIINGDAQRRFCAEYANDSRQINGFYTEGLCEEGLSGNNHQKQQDLYRNVEALARNLYKPISLHTSLQCVMLSIP